MLLLEIFVLILGLTGNLVFIDNFSSRFSAQADTYISPYNVHGWAWSENVGWLSMNCYNEFGTCPNGGYYWTGRENWDNCCPELGVGGCLTEDVVVTRRGDFAAYHENLATANLQGWWRLNDGDSTNWVSSGDVYDNSGNDNHGTAYNVLPDQASRCTKVADFDGSTSYISVESDSSLQITGDLTIEAWVKDESGVSASYGIAGRVSSPSYSGYGITKQGLYYKFWTASAGAYLYTQSNTTYNDTNWHHIAGVRESGTNYLYIDGVLQTDTDTPALADAGANEPFVIGRYFTNHDDHYWIGKIDNVAIYNRAKTAAEIAVDANSAVNPAQYGVDYNTSTNKLTDYGWSSENMGWVCVGGTCSGTPPDGRQTSWACVGRPSWNGASHTCSGDYGEDFNGSTNLIAHWKLNNVGSGGTTNDNSGNGHTATLEPDYVGGDAPIQIKGKWGNALDFDGTNDYITVTDHNDLDITDDITIGFWINPDESKVAELIMKGTSSSAEAYEIYQNSNKISFRLNNNAASITSSTSITSDKWNHIAVTYDKDLSSDNMKIFINGVQDVNTGNYTTDIVVNEHDLILGAYPAQTYAFNGTMENVSIWSRVKTDAEIWDDAHMEITGWAKVETLGDSGWLRLDGHDTNDATWGTFLKDYETFYIMDGYAANRHPDESLDSTNLQGFWKFNEEEWTGAVNEVVDTSSKLNHGVRQGGANITSDYGYLSNAGSFDGTGDYISIPDDVTLQITGDLTIGAWVRDTSGGGNWAGIAGRMKNNSSSYTGYGIVKKNNDYYSFWTSDAGTYTYTDSNVVSTDDDWHHIVGVRDSGTNYLYIDGALQTDNDTVALANPATAEPFVIGRYYTDFDNYYLDGYIDHVFVYSEALDSDEVLEIYNKATPYCAGWEDFEQESTPVVPMEFNSLTVTAPDCDQILAQWEESDWAESYTYYRCDDVSASDCASCSYTEYSVLAGSCASDECSVTDTGMTESTGYCYKVKAHNESGTTWCSDSSPTSPHPQWRSTTVCVPQEQELNDNTCGQVTAYWLKNTSSATDGYNIYRSLLSNGCTDLESSNCSLISHLSEALDYDANDNGTDDLVGQWKMNEVSWNGTADEVKDSSGRATPNHCTATGTATTTDTAKFSKAGSFGDNNYLTCGTDDSLILTSDLTIESWVRSTGGSGNRGIAGRMEEGTGSADGYGTYKDTSNYFVFWTSDGGSSATTLSNSAYTDTNWHHIVGVRDSGTNYLYVDGVLQTDTDTPGLGEPATDQEFVIGRLYTDQSNSYWQGQIDNTAVYNVAKTAEQIRMDYEAGQHIHCSGDQCGLETICHIQGSDTNCDQLQGAASTCCFTDQRVIPYINYYYWVTATSEAGESPSLSYSTAAKTLCWPPPEEIEE